jgi:type I restriction enzyme R subunit
MPYNEADTRSKLIDPTIHALGWTEDTIKREVTAGAIEIINGKPRRKPHGRADYTLRLIVQTGAQPVAVAILEAKAEHLSPGYGLEQAKAYADARRLNVPFVFSSNGHQYVEYDRFTGITTMPRPLDQFPTPVALRARYEQGKGFTLTDPGALPLLTRYAKGEGTRRYYQDAAIRAALEKIARGSNRVLLTLATGAGKTFIAVNLLKRIYDAGQMKRALFVCDRDELRKQGTLALADAFGTDAAPVFLNSEGNNNAKNARVHVATYQTLGVDSDEADATFLTTHYPPDFFSHIIIDECHRSAWGKWSQVLTRNPNAVQIGLTATPRQIVVTEDSATDNRDVLADVKITADNIRHFGEPVYEYDMAQGIEDGYLAACQIIKRDIVLNNQDKSEAETGITTSDFKNAVLTDAVTGAPVLASEMRERYEATSFEARLLLPERVEAMCADLFTHLLQTGGLEQKTVIFCAGDAHAGSVAATMGNLYAQWCKEQGRVQADYYAFKCTRSSSGSDYIADLRGSNRSHFIATTVDLLTTGVDVPNLLNIVFFKYVKSPISFYQMVGRGTRIDPATGKLMFRVYDYTNATRLFGKEFLSKAQEESEKDADGTGTEPGEGKPTTQTIQVHGFEVHITDAGQYILTMVDGKAMPVSVEEYKAKLAAQLVSEAPTLNDFRTLWINPGNRRGMLEGLPDSGNSLFALRAAAKMEDYDFYDILADLGYGMAPLTRTNRADAFGYKNAQWLAQMPDNTAATLKALAQQFAKAGTEELENPAVLNTPLVKTAGGIIALRALGNPAQVLQQAKERMFAV